MSVPNMLVELEAIKQFDFKLARQFFEAIKSKSKESTWLVRVSLLALAAFGSIATGTFHLVTGNGLVTSAINERFAGELRDDVCTFGTSGKLQILDIGGEAAICIVWRDVDNNPIGEKIYEI